MICDTNETQRRTDARLEVPFNFIEKKRGDRNTMRRSSLAVLDFVHLGSTLALRSFLRFGSAMSVYGMTRLGSLLEKVRMCTSSKSKHHSFIMKL